MQARISGQLSVTSTIRGRAVHPDPQFHLTGDCQAWSALFADDGCRVKTRADWEKYLADWHAQRNQ